MDIPQPPKPPKSKSCRVCKVLVVIILIFFIGVGVSVYLYKTDYGCTVAGIRVQGQIQTYNDTGFLSDGSQVFAAASEDIAQKIRDAEKNNAVKAILLEIDSPGGFPVAAEELVTAIKNIKKPNVGQIREYGTSAAYWTASAANWVIASKLSTVGSIGITSSYVDYAKKNEKDGITYNQLSTGKFKDMGDPDKPLTDDERLLFERDLKIINEQFIASVASNRHLPLESVRALADGSALLGDAAKAKGLIDEIGGYDEAKAYLEKKIGESPEVCWK